MTLRGTARLELSFLFEGPDTDSGFVLTETGVENYSKVKFAATGGCALTRQERDAMWRALPEWLQEKLMDQAAEDADLVDDDDAEDASREVA